MYEASARLWLYDGSAAWHFLSLPEAVAAEIRSEFGGMSRGFGSLRVEVTVGATV